jgi:hypothetical protein
MPTPINRVTFVAKPWSLKYNDNSDANLFGEAYPTEILVTA